jgi:hypothetical protein
MRADINPPGDFDVSNARRLQQMIRISVLRVPEVVDSSDGFQTMPTNERPNSFSKRSKSASTAGRSGVFFEKGGGFFSDVFHRQAMAVIGIENEAVGFLGGLEGVA